MCQMKAYDLWFNSTLYTGHGVGLTDTGKNSLSALTASPFTHLTHREEEHSPLTLASGWPFMVQCVKTKDALWRAQRGRELSLRLPALLLPPYPAAHNLGFRGPSLLHPPSQAPVQPWAWSLPEAGWSRSCTSSHICFRDSLREEHRPETSLEEKT